MQIKIYTIPLFEGDEVLEEMNKFLRGNKVVDISKSFVQQGNVAYWSFCVTYLVGVPSKVQQPGERKEKVDYKQILSEAEFVRFALLRTLRKQLAENDAVPAFAVFTDAELAEMAKMSELSAKNLLKINGLGEKRVEKYGEPLCRMFTEQKKTLEEVKN